MEDALDHYRTVAGSVLARYNEGNRINNIDKINYYKARENYYSIKINLAQNSVDKERFLQKRNSSRRAWKSIEFRVAA
jgi:hypothetical protein